MGVMVLPTVNIMMHFLFFINYFITSKAPGSVVFILKAILFDYVPTLFWFLILNFWGLFSLLVPYKSIILLPADCVWEAFSVMPMLHKDLILVQKV
jgi:hypothetical protein